MINYSSLDFLEFFDTEERLYPENGMVEYIVTSEEKIVLVIFLNPYEERVYFRLGSERNINLASFDFEGITSIVCDKNNSNYVRFLFYKNDHHIPVVIASIKPNISLDLTLE